MQSETQLMQAVWRKALAKGRVELNFADPKEATRVRFALYNAVRAVRKGQERDDELLKASKVCVVQKRGGQILILRREEMDSYKEILKVLEMTEEEVSAGTEPQVAEDQEIAESAERLLREIQGLQAGGNGDEGDEGKPSSTTPYYTR